MQQNDATQLACAVRRNAPMRLTISPLPTRYKRVGQRAGKDDGGAKGNIAAADAEVVHQGHCHASVRQGHRKQLPQPDTTLEPEHTNRQHQCRIEIEDQAFQCGGNVGKTYEIKIAREVVPEKIRSGRSSTSRPSRRRICRDGAPSRHL